MAPASFTAIWINGAIRASRSACDCVSTLLANVYQPACNMSPWCSSPKPGAFHTPGATSPFCTPCDSAPSQVVTKTCTPGLVCGTFGDVYRTLNKSFCIRLASQSSPCISSKYARPDMTPSWVIAAPLLYCAYTLHRLLASVVACVADSISGVTVGSTLNFM